MGSIAVNNCLILHSKVAKKTERFPDALSWEVLVLHSRLCLVCSLKAVCGHTTSILVLRLNCLVSLLKLKRSLACTDELRFDRGCFFLFWPVRSNGLMQRSLLRAHVQKRFEACIRQKSRHRRRKTRVARIF